MAIDSKEKRASTIGINYVSGPSPIPNVSKDKEWRQEVGYGYSGIATGAVSTVVEDVVLAFAAGGDALPMAMNTYRQLRV